MVPSVTVTITDAYKIITNLISDASVTISKLEVVELSVQDLTQLVGIIHELISEIVDALLRASKALDLSEFYRLLE